MHLRIKNCRLCDGRFHIRPACMETRHFLFRFLELLLMKNWQQEGWVFFCKTISESDTELEVEIGSNDNIELERTIHGKWVPCRTEPTCFG